MKPNKNEYGKNQENNRNKEQGKQAGNESWKQGQNKSASSESWKKEQGKNKGEDRNGNNGSKYFNNREEE